MLGHHVLPGAQRFALEEQSAARIPVGGDVQLYFVGGSNLAWQTWPDQLHMYLRDLGYVLPRENYNVTNIDFASRLAPTCDDESAFAGLSTPRVAHAGWGSWNFAFDSDEDCVRTPYSGHAPGEYPFRAIAGHAVSCYAGWACNPTGSQANESVRPASVAADANTADVVLLSNWVNDFKQQYCGYSCYNGTHLDDMAIANITVASLLRVIRAVHEVNPSALVLVMALYPDADGAFVRNSTLNAIGAINERVASGVEAEPNTSFVDFNVPADMEMFQTKHPGHLNCRGDRLMAFSVLRAMFQRKVLARTLARPRGEEASACLTRTDCAGISNTTCCQGAAACRVAGSGQCVPYGPGKER